MSERSKGLNRRQFLELGAAGAAFLSLGEAAAGDQVVPDTAGAPVAVARMDAARSYAGMPSLLQRHLNSDAAAWKEIGSRIDYTYEHLGRAMDALLASTDLASRLAPRLERGQRLLFKPNLVATACIDPLTHGPFMGSAACTEWAFIAALMRWFHDRLGVSYHRMALGEAATSMPLFAAMGTTFNPARQRVTPEGLIEGKTGGFYFGWGFYFVRRYLAERLAPDAADDPMRGYEESVAGTYIPPGLAGDRLMVYDLNRIADDPRKGRDVPVPDGVNFRSITLHKAIVGGDPTNPEEVRAYPGSILVNVPKLKIHAIALLTNVIKNLGIGLYPMQATHRGGTEWDYASPDWPIPAMKEPIPHQVWVPELDHANGLVKRDEEGRYLVRETGGLPATMIDIVKAAATQDVMMVHVVDGVEAINRSHTGGGEKVPEGLAVAGLDPVATDLFCARYLFSNIGSREAAATGLVDRAGGPFACKVPVATLNDGAIVTGSGYDCALARERTFERAEQRGLGQRRYHVVGHDAASGSRLVSVAGRLGTLDQEGRFADVVTGTLYFATSKLPWDLQRTALSYLEASDQLTGSSWKKRFLETFDEDDDGVVTYEEFGRKGMWHTGMYMSACSSSAAGSDPVERLGLDFCSSALGLRDRRADWNEDGHDLFAERLVSRACLTAFRVAHGERTMAGTEQSGHWPTVEQALEMDLRNDLQGLYTEAFAYADARLNSSGYIGSPIAVSFRPALRRYLDRVKSGAAKPLDFTVFIPEEVAHLVEAGMPNLESTKDRSLMFTMRLAEGREALPGQAPFARARNPRA